jgi:hypothetical protein
VTGTLSAGTPLVVEAVDLQGAVPTQTLHDAGGWFLRMESNGG